jgi:hypothetical protein
MAAFETDRSGLGLMLPSDIYLIYVAIGVFGIMFFISIVGCVYFGGRYLYTLAKSYGSLGILAFVLSWIFLLPIMLLLCLIIEINSTPEWKRSGIIGSKTD